jgi:hypothetical protein
MTGGRSSLRMRFALSATKSLTAATSAGLSRMSALLTTNTTCVCVWHVRVWHARAGNLHGALARHGSMLEGRYRGRRVEKSNVSRNPTCREIQCASRLCCGTSHGMQAAGQGLLCVTCLSCGAHLFLPLADVLKEADLGLAERPVGAHHEQNQVRARHVPAHAIHTVYKQCVTIV